MQALPYIVNGYLAYYKHVPLSPCCNARMKVSYTRAKKPVLRCEKCLRFYQAQYVDPKALLEKQAAPV